MTKHPFSPAAVVLALLTAISAAAQTSTPPLTAGELEAAYTTAIQNRTADIVRLLDLNDADKSNRVTGVILTQYRALRARDEFISAAVGGDPTAKATERLRLLECISKPLHERFLANLAADLSSDQIEKVKDKMTYNKVKVTYDAYCVIIPNLTDEQKTHVLTVLKEAREEAMDGGSANEKSEIFQKYKNRINDYLTAQGHDVAKAFKDWEARQEAKVETTAAK